MQAFSSTTQAAPSSIIGVEPFPLTTYSLGLTAGQGALKAGTFIDAAGLKTATIANVHGVLAYDVTTDATVEVGATLYLSGSFIRDRVVDANTPAVVDAAAEAALRDKGIYLERGVGF
jgi:hypothetical protein